MPRNRNRDQTVYRRFGWRDAFAFVRALPNMMWRRDERVSYTSLARLSAVNQRTIPPRRQFIASDGAQIAYRSYASSSTAHLVLVHGSACFGDQFNHLARHIAAIGLAQVHTLDLRGHGASGQPGLDPDRFAQDVGEFVASLHDSHDNCQIFLGGHSAGGGLAINVLGSTYDYGISGGYGISGCLLLAPFLGIDNPTVRPLFGGWLKRIWFARLGLVILANLIGVTRYNRIPVVEFNAEASLHDPRFAREWSFTSVHGLGPGPVRADRSALSAVPIRLIAGDRDECFRSHLYASAIAAFAPDADVVILGGLGHWDVLTDSAALDACCAWLKALIPLAETEHSAEVLDNHARFAS